MTHGDPEETDARRNGVVALNCIHDRFAISIREPLRHSHPSSASSDQDSPPDTALSYEAVRRLTGTVLSLAKNPGRTVSAVPDLWFFHGDQPGGFTRARSDMMYLAVAISGRKLVRIGDQTLTNDRLHYLVLHGEKNYEAAIMESSPPEPYVALGLQLPPDIVARTLLELAEAGAGAPCPPAQQPPAFVGPLDDRLADPLCRLLSCLDDALDRHVVAPLIIQEIIFRLLRSEAASVLRSSTSAERTKIVRAMRFIEENAAEPLSVTTIAQEVAMSPSHFAHRFRDLAGMSPKQYVKRVRLEEARQRLLDSRITVSQVGESVGYASASHFSRDFRRRYGVSPSVYADVFLTATTVTLGFDG